MIMIMTLVKMTRLIIMVLMLKITAIEMQMTKTMKNAIMMLMVVFLMIWRI